MEIKRDRITSINPKNDVAGQLLEFRLTEELSQEKMARMIGVTRVSYNSWERERKRPSAISMVKINKMLKRYWKYWNDPLMEKKRAQDEELMRRMVYISKDFKYPFGEEEIEEPEESTEFYEELERMTDN